MAQNQVEPEALLGRSGVCARGVTSSMCVHNCNRRWDDKAVAEVVCWHPHLPHPP